MAAPSIPTLIDFRQPLPPPDTRTPPTLSQPKFSSQRTEGEVKDCVAARRIQKADREKLRRDLLNEHFTELGNALDPKKPKYDKATILSDTIQLLKDLTAQVNKLKSEYTTLTEESHLELKTPGLTTDQDISSAQRKPKKSTRKESSIKEGSSSSRYSSSHSIQDSSSDSVVGGKKSDDLESENS